MSSVKEHGVERKGILSIENSHLKKSRNKVYVALEELNFVWDEVEIDQVKKLWRQGTPIDEIAEVMDRDIDEIGILIIDQCRKNKIKQRPGGLWGGDEK
ncbi:MAG TPA: helix-turn-helix domain containing protein [Bacillota bacterium]|nr:helix-turn-helix domain containing protein [Bacillota bacterium]